MKPKLSFKGLIQKLEDKIYLLVAILKIKLKTISKLEVTIIKFLVIEKISLNFLKGDMIS